MLLLWQTQAQRACRPRGREFLLLGMILPISRACLSLPGWQLLLGEAQRVWGLVGPSERVFGDCWDPLGEFGDWWDPVGRFGDWWDPVREFGDCCDPLGEFGDW